MNIFQETKLWLVEHLLLAKDALHIYVALILFFGVALAFRWRIGGWKPWAVVLAAALAGEAWDIVDTARAGIPQLPWENLKDIWNTLFWPIAITALARWTRVFEREGSGDRF